MYSTSTAEQIVAMPAQVAPQRRWTHQRIGVRIALLLHPYVREQGLGELFVAPLDVLLEPNLVLQPDLLVVPAGLLRKKSDVVGRLLLAVEVVSPGSARHDRVRKRPAYQRNRVPEYWVVDDPSQTVERWRPEDDRPELVAGRLEWRPEGASEPFVLDLPAFFAEVLPAEE